MKADPGAHHPTCRPIDSAAPCSTESITLEETPAHVSDISQAGVHPQFLDRDLVDRMFSLP